MADEPKLVEFEALFEGGPHNGCLGKLRVPRFGIGMRIEVGGATYEAQPGPAATILEDKQAATDNICPRFCYVGYFLKPEELALARNLIGQCCSGFSDRNMVAALSADMTVEQFELAKEKMAVLGLAVGITKASDPSVAELLEERRTQAVPQTAQQEQEQQQGEEVSGDKGGQNQPVPTTERPAPPQGSGGVQVAQAAGRNPHYRPPLNRWRIFEIAAPEGYSFGIVMDSGGLLSLTMRLPGMTEWVNGKEPEPESVNTIEPGAVCYQVTSDDRGPEVGTIVLDPAAYQMAKELAAISWHRHDSAPAHDGTRLNSAAMVKLLQDDVEWLSHLPHTLERMHVRTILESYLRTLEDFRNRDERRPGSEVPAIPPER